MTALRRAAQRPIVQLERKLQKRDFGRSIKRAVKKVHAPKDRRDLTFQDWARVGISRSVDAFFTAAAADLSSIESLHAMRIEGKQLRYAVEYFADAFGPELRTELYPEIERIQGLLGSVNDHASALANYESWQAEWTEPEESALLAELIAVETVALDESRQEFFRWWNPQRATELQRKLHAVTQPPGHEEVA